VKSPIIDPVMSRPVHLVINPDHPMTNACRAIRQITLEVARDLVHRGIWEGRLTPEMEKVAS
jgi:LysR family transcriptional regulator, nitrogen assimilation regulatory protein